MKEHGPGQCVARLALPQVHGSEPSTSLPFKGSVNTVFLGCEVAAFPRSRVERGRGSRIAGVYELKGGGRSALGNWPPIS